MRGSLTHDARTMLFVVRDNCSCARCACSQEKQKNNGVMPEGVVNEVIREYNKVRAVCVCVWDPRRLAHPTFLVTVVCVVTCATQRISKPPERLDPSHLPPSRLFLCFLFESRRAALWFMPCLCACVRAQLYVGFDGATHCAAKW